MIEYRNQKPGLFHSKEENLKVILFKWLPICIAFWIAFFLVLILAGVVEKG
jgi:hypothetical protein